MTKTEIRKSLATAAGSEFPTISEISRYMGVSRQSVRNLLDGLDFFQQGKRKRYFVGDVADRIMQNRGM